MPPKSIEPAKAKMPTLIAGLPMEEITQEQLEENVVRSREELEGKESNYLQLKRNNICSSLRIIRRQLEEAEADRKNSDKEIEDTESRHQVEIKVYKQKMKYFLNEQQNTISELKAEGLASTEAEQKEQAQLEKEDDKRIGSVRVEMQELDIENIIKEVELKHDEERTTKISQRAQFIEKLQAKHEKIWELWQHGLDTTMKTLATERRAFWTNYVYTSMKNQGDVSSDVTVRAKHESFVQHVKELYSDRNKMENNQEEIILHSHGLESLTGLFPELEKKNEDLESELTDKIKNSIEEEDTSEMVRAKDPVDGEKDCEALQKKFSEGGAA